MLSSSSPNITARVLRPLSRSTRYYDFYAQVFKKEHQLKPCWLFHVNEMVDVTQFKILLEEQIQNNSVINTIEFDKTDVVIYPSQLRVPTFKIKDYLSVVGDLVPINETIDITIKLI